jgi:hypothetical protein
MIDIYRLTAGQTISFTTKMYKDGRMVDVTRTNATIDSVETNRGKLCYLVLPEEPQNYWLPIFVYPTEIHAVDGIFVKEDTNT